MRDVARPEGYAYPDLSSLELAVAQMPAFQAIEELTAKPSERGFCEEKDCVWWEVGTRRDYRGGTFPHGLSYCQHKDAKEGFCPKEEGGDEGG